MKIECGPAAGRLRKIGITAAILLAFSVWFGWDGWVGYPRHNRQRYADQFPTRPNADTIQINSQATAAVAKELASASDPAAEAEKRLGPPQLKTEHDIRWFGPAGTLVVPVPQGAPAFDDKGVKSDVDLMLQKSISVGLGLGFLAVAANFLRVRNTRYTLDDAGLKLPGKPLIPWDAMKKLDGDRVDEQGWVGLHYADNGGTEIVRLDSFEIDAFGDFIDAICQKKGFENPLPVRSATDSRG